MFYNTCSKCSVQLDLYGFNFVNMRLKKKKVNYWEFVVYTLCFFILAASTSKHPPVFCILAVPDHFVLFILVVLVLSRTVVGIIMINTHY